MPGEHILQAFKIKRLGEHILHRLANQRMIGNFDVADDIFLAGYRLRENTPRQQIFRRACVEFPAELYLPP